MIFVGARRRAKQHATLPDGYDGTKTRVME